MPPAAGSTESGLDALGRDLPYLQSVACPCGKLAALRWELTLKPRELKASLGKDAELAGGGGALRHRARAAGARGAGAHAGRRRPARAPRLHALKSLAFEIARGPGADIRITGKGYGHGAGLCQWGAKAYADQGWDYQRILAPLLPGRGAADAVLSAAALAHGGAGCYKPLPPR